MPQSVHHLHHGVGGGVVADGIVTAGDIVVNSAGDGYTGNAVVTQMPCTPERAVTADDHHTLNAVAVAGIDSLLHTLFGGEFRATGGVKHRAAPLNDAGNRTQIHGDQLVIDKTAVSTYHAVYFHAVGNGCAHHGTHGGVHAGGVTAAG